MDANRFDMLARSLTDARSRRGALTTLLGGTLGLLGLAETAAKRGKKGKRNRKGNGTGNGTGNGGNQSPPLQKCTAAAECGNDSDGSMCACRTNSANQGVCTKLNGTFFNGGTCANCKAGEQCVLPPGGAECVLPCGTPTG